MNRRDTTSASFLPALGGLHRLLSRARQGARNGPANGKSKGRGKTPARGPCEPFLADLHDEPLGPEVLTPLAPLAEAYDLNLFDLRVLLIALAPELDLSLQRCYRALQDDEGTGPPSVDLALNLLCRSAEEKLAMRSRFDATAPLLRSGLLYLLPGRSSAAPLLLECTLRMEPQALRILLGNPGLDPRLWRWCEIVHPQAMLDDLFVDAETASGLARLSSCSREEGRPLRLYLSGPGRIVKRRAAEALAAEGGSRLLALDGAALAERSASDSSIDADHILRTFFREARRLEALVYLGDADRINARQVVEAMRAEAWSVVLAGENPDWAPAWSGLVPFQIPFPGSAERRPAWHRELSAAGFSLEEQDLETLASRFQLTADDISAAVATACHEAVRRGSQGIELPDLFRAARSASGHMLAALAQRIHPLHTWTDLVLPEDELEQLREMCRRVIHREKILVEWGFGRRMSLGKGVTALFAGPSGTGKTMAAEIVARELGLELFKINLAGLVSKYIGETEKNLDRVFRAAENANAILFFDEADALFGKRAETKDAHDRYANIEVSYLLQKMEEYEGVAILATNLRSNLDEAFVRRLAFAVQFPFPDERHRRLIWEGVWPAGTRIAPGVDFDFFARELRLSGGNIRNIALAAAYLSADNGAVTLDALVRATRREYQKMGHVLAEFEIARLLGPVAPVSIAS